MTKTTLRVLRRLAECRRALHGTIIAYDEAQDIEHIAGLLIHEARLHTYPDDPEAASAAPALHYLDEARRAISGTILTRSQVSRIEHAAEQLVRECHIRTAPPAATEVDA